MLQNLSIKLKNARIKSQLSRKQVSELVGISVSMIGFYECGERFPSLPILIKLATCYKVSIDYLLDHDFSSRNTLSLDGLTEEEIQVLKFTAERFRASSKVSC